jgi:hypothetical protein
LQNARPFGRVSVPIGCSDYDFELTIRLIAFERLSTALIAREYRIRVGPITPTAPVP